MGCRRRRPTHGVGPAPRHGAGGGWTCAQIGAQIVAVPRNNMVLNSMFISRSFASIVSYS